MISKNPPVWRAILGTAGVLLAGALLSGCLTIGERPPPPAREPPNGVEERQITNLKVENYFAAEENVQYLTGIPQRIAVVGSGEIETLLAFGAADRILAAEPWYPMEEFLLPELRPLAKDLPTVSYGHLSLEYLMYLNPDLLVTQQCLFTEKRFLSTDFWNRRGVATFVPWNTNSPDGHVHQESIESEMKFLHGMGQILQEEKKAAAMIDGVYQTLTHIQQLAADQPKPKALVIEFMGKEIASYDATKLAGNMILRLGGEIPETPPLIDMETLLMIDPDVLFVVCYGAEDARQVVDRIVNNKALNSLKVVHSGRICPLRLEYVYSSEVRTEEALKLIGRGLYPALQELTESDGL